ncbi:protein kinase [Sorangium sp. So ce1014]|uniref:nSTAND1 domain-containing NTPase n=1 Tax=Sorangium sp. So ce1014 TaxID=3133326 RepID=UPI003F5E5C87
MSSAVGSVIGCYEIIRPLGRGGMGEVLLARDTRLGRLVAIKLLTCPSEQRFLSEARVTAQFSHENIVTIYEIGQHNGYPYMVLEYLKGMTLRQWVDERAERSRDAGAGPSGTDAPGLPPGRAAELMIPVVRAMVSAHALGIVHRDLKPSNIMLTDTGLIKVLDFGIATLLDFPEAGREPRDTLVELEASQTQSTSNRRVGSMPYMSPEQWNAGSVDHRADIWAVGLILAELVLGHHLLAPLFVDSLRAVGDLDIAMPSMLEMRPELGKLSSIIDRCLLKCKEDRIGTARELLEELESLAIGRRRAPVQAEEQAPPYLGLSAFQESDATRFFGRARVLGQAVTRLREQPLLVVVGPSGAGKSSFVRAGLIPALKQTGDAWMALILRPGTHPLTTVAELLLAHGWQTSTESADPRLAQRAESSDRAELLARLRAAPGLLGAQLRARARRKRARILLFIDQGEELYTLAAADERGAFLASLAGVADDMASPLRVVIALRSDFLDRMTEAHAAMAEFGRGLMLLPPMDREGLREALMRPLGALEYRFESPGLVEDMLDTLEHTAGALPLLQFTSARLWERRDRARHLLTDVSYRQMGGVAGALASHADTVLGAMSPSERKLVRTVLLRLVTPERTRALASVGELRELGAGPADTSADIDRVLGRLIEARLLTAESSGEIDATVELVHESLITSWPTLAQWLTDHQDDAAFLARLRHAAKEWEANGRAEGLLWRGQTADEARRWQARYSGGFSPAEQRYLQAVLGLAERSRQQRRRIVAGSMGLLVLVAASMSYLAWQMRVEATRAQMEAVLARDMTRLAAARANQDDPTTAVALLREIESPDPPRGWSELAKHVLDAGVAPTVLLGHSDAVLQVAWSPEGTRIASASWDNTVRVWNADGSGEPLVLRGHTDGVDSVAWSPDGTRIVSSSHDKTVRVWNADGSGAPRVLRGHTDQVWAVACSPDGTRIVSGSTDGTVRVWNADGSGVPLVLPGHSALVASVAWSPDGTRIVSGSWDKIVRVWNADGSGPPLLLQGHTANVYSVAWSPDSTRIVSGSYDKTMRVWNADGSGAPQVLTGHSDWVTSAKFSPDGTRIVSSSWDHTLRVWNADGSGSPFVLRGHAGAVWSVAWSPDGTRIASSSYDGTARVWNADRHSAPLVMSGHSDNPWTVEWSPDGTRVVSASYDKTVRVWSADGSGPPLVLRGHSDCIRSAAWSPDSTRIASGAQDKTVRVWNADGSGKPLVLEGHSRWVQGVAWSPDGARIASVAKDRTVRVWNLGGSGEGSGAPLLLQGYSELVNRPPGDDSSPPQVNSVAWSPDGTRIAYPSWENTAWVRSADGSGAPLVLQGHSDHVLWVAWSPDGTRIASASNDKTVRVWNADGSGAPLVLRGHSDQVLGVAWSPDGARIASSSHDGTVRIWNADGSGEPVVLQGLAGAVWSVSWSPDGTRIASSHGDKSVRVWRDLRPVKRYDPRLWTATTYCLPIAERQRFLGTSEQVSQEEHARCVRRVKQASASSS